MDDDDVERAIQEAHLGSARPTTVNVASRASWTVVVIGDLNGDGKVGGEDAKIARDQAIAVLSGTPEQAGKLAKFVVHSPLAKDIGAALSAGPGL